jgi:hypothetical protein
LLSWSRVPFFSGIAGSFCDDVFVNLICSSLAMVTQFLGNREPQGKYEPSLFYDQSAQQRALPARSVNACNGIFIVTRRHSGLP